jgi:tRNA threonylcarbamoyladenosine biosynthesis protein TsaB
MILAIDTATRWLGLALHDGAAVLAEVGWRSDRTQTIELAPAVQGMLGRAGVESGDLKAIAVAIGPGSYTGLRVGLAVAKGLALAEQFPLIGVPTLDIIAAGVGYRDGRLLTAVRAGRRRISAATYAWDEKKGWEATQRPANTTWDELLPALSGTVAFAGEIDAAAAKQIRAAGRSFTVIEPAFSTRRAGVLAELGWRRLRRGEVDDAAALAPDYLQDPAGA